MQLIDYAQYIDYITKVKGMRGKLISVVGNFCLLLILLFCFVAPELNAEPVSKISISAGPSFNYQRIIYDSDYYPNRKTIGPCFSFSFDYSAYEHIQFGANVTYEYESYRNFYKYHDLKVSINATVHLSYRNRTERNVNIFVLMGSGVDFVFRNDGDFGLYFLTRLGLILDIRLTEKTSIYIKPVGELTFQDGSTVLHSSAGIGVTVLLGGAK